MGSGGWGGGYQALLPPPIPGSDNPGRGLGFPGPQPRFPPGVHISCHPGQKGTVI